MTLKKATEEVKHLFNSETGPRMVSVFNELVSGTEIKPVKKFTSKNAGYARFAKLIQDKAFLEKAFAIYNIKVEEDKKPESKVLVAQLKKRSLEELITLHNEIADKSLSVLPLDQNTKRFSVLDVSLFIAEVASNDPVIRQLVAIRLEELGSAPAKPATSTRKRAQPKVDDGLDTPQRRSKAIALSWQYQDIADKRAQRNKVAVTREGSKIGHIYKSVRVAFLALNLNLSKHIKFRMELKAAGELNRFGYHWQIVESEKE